MYGSYRCFAYSLSLPLLPPPPRQRASAPARRAATEQRAIATESSLRVAERSQRCARLVVDVDDDARLGARGTIGVRAPPRIALAQPAGTDGRMRAADVGRLAGVGGQVVESARLRRLGARRGADELPWLRSDRGLDAARGECG